MQNPRPRSRVRVPKSCTECRRRKQKCIPTKEGPCVNCLRRYPPVECIGLPEPRGQNSAKPLTLREAEPSTSLQINTSDTLENAILDRRKALPLIGAPRGFAGRVTATNTMNGGSIESTPQNAELLYFFQEYVMPGYVSVDGKDLPAMFLKDIFPWMLQSPLMPNIAILMSSFSLRLERGLDIDPQQTISIKAHVLALINQYLKQEDFSVISDEAIRAVTHLVISEWWWGNKESALVHWQGIKGMVKFHGNVTRLPDPVLSQVLTLTDLGLACSYEGELNLDYPEPLISPTRGDSPYLLPPTPAAWLISPLFQSSSTFTEKMGILGIDPEAAMILDDIRFLTLSITSPTSSTTVTKIQSTASWLHERVKNLPPLVPLSEKELITSSIRLSALIYTSCIVSLTPFSQVTHHLAEIKKHVAGVPLSRWKQIPGILLWILMVISPTCGVGMEDRKWRKLMPVTAMAIGLEGFGLGIAYLKANWLVQRWIARERAKKEEVVEE